MAKKISKQELGIEGDLLGDLTRSLKDNEAQVKATEAAHNAYVDAMKSESEVAKNLTKQINENDATTAKGLKELEQLRRQAHQTIANIQKLEQGRLRTEKLQEQLTQQRLRTEKAANAEKKKTLTAYQEESRKLTELSNRYKDLAVQNKENTKEGRNLLREVTALDSKLKQVDATVGQNQRSVGNYQKAVNGLRGALAQLGLAFGVFQIIKSAGNIITNFNQAQGDLLAISGKTADEMAGLTKQAKDLGASTQFSATQITELQIELAKLGFTTEQISKSTGGIANFAAATGVEIPRAAALAGSALRAFGLEADEIDRVVSTLGVATTKTALDFSQLETGLSTVAPVAKAFGFSIEDTTALLGQLANSGFDASSAATATRNILLNLADANGDLAKQLGRPIKSADDLAAGLKELKDGGIDLATALELTDTRSVAAFNTFLDGSGTLVELRDSITGVDEELAEMAEKRLDTVSGQFTLLESAWEGVILAFDEGTGASNFVKGFIRFLADNLPTIVSLIAKLVVGFVSYKVALIAVNAVQSVTDKGVKSLVKEFFNLSKSTKEATTGVSKVGGALKSIGWAAIAVLIAEVVTEIYELASGAREAEYTTRRLQESTATGTEKATALIGKYTKALQAEINAIDLSNMSEQEKTKARAEATEATRKDIAARISYLRSIYAELNARRLNLEAIRDEAKAKASGVFADPTDVLNAQLATKATIEVTAKQKELRAAIAELRIEEESLGQTTIQLTSETKKLTKEKDKEKKTVKELTVEYEKLKGRMQDTRELDLRDIKEAERIEKQRVLNVAEYFRIQKEIELSKAKEIGDADAVLRIEEELKQARIDVITAQRNLDLIDVETFEEAAKIRAQAELDIQNLNEEAINEEKHRYEETEKWIELTTDLIEKNIDKRIELLNRELDATQKQQERLRDLADSGNIQAEESLAVADQIEREKLAEKQKLEQRKQQLEIASAFLTAYNQKLSEGKPTGQALTEALAEKALIEQVIASLPAFLDGVEDTGIHGKGVDGKGGFVSILHPNEAVLKKEHNEKKKKAGLSNEQAIDYAVKYKSLIVDGTMLSQAERQHEMMDNTTSGWGDIAILSSLNDLNKQMKNVEKAIKDRPSDVYGVEELAKGVIQITKTTRKQGLSVQNKYITRT